jgi:hypothetical protein
MSIQNYVPTSLLISFIAKFQKLTPESALLARQKTGCDFLTMLKPL